MIKSIRLINWRSHADTALEFRKGTNLLVGIMGAGKSSVLEGISFALFGTFPAIERRKMKLDDVIHLNETKARVILVFEWDGTSYRVERAIERAKRGTSSSADLYRNDSLVEHGASAVSDYIQSLLSLDYDLFTRAIYCEQNNMDHFFTIDPRRRKEEIDILLGLDRFETARTNIISVMNRFSSRREGLESRFSRDKLVELEAREKTLETEISGLRSGLAQTLAALQSKEKGLAETQSSFEAMKKTKEHFEQLEKDSIRLGAQCESMSKELEKTPYNEQSHVAMKVELAQALKKKAELQAQMKSSDSTLNSVSRELGALEAGIKAAAESKKRLAAVKAELASILGSDTQERLLDLQKACENSLLSLESDHKSISREIEEINELIPRLRSGLSECPLCSSKLSEDGVEHVKAEKAELLLSKKKRLGELASIVQVKRKENEFLSSRLRKAIVLSERVASLAKDSETAGRSEEKKAELSTRLSKLKEDRSLLEKQGEELLAFSEKHRASILESERMLARKNELSVSVVRLGEIKEKLASTHFDRKAFDDVRSTSESLRIETEKLLSDRRLAESKLKSSQEMSSILLGELAAMRGVSGEITWLAQLEMQLSVYKSALLETQTGLRTTLTDAINSAMNEIWPIFYPYRNYRAVRLGVSEKDYTFEVDDSGAWKQLETVASGGERACAALTLRVAMAMVLTPKLSWLILDEPTHNLDRAAVDMLSSALEMKVPEVVNQTFVITHDEAFMGSEFASSYLLVRDKERNGETKAEGI
jgi:DNA repair protein SbcC/Rad50